MSAPYRPPYGVKSVWGDPLVSEDMVSTTSVYVAGRLPVADQLRLLARPGGPDPGFWVLVAREIECHIAALDAERTRPDLRDLHACRAWSLGAVHAAMGTYPGLPGPFSGAYAAGWLAAHDASDPRLRWGRRAAEEDLREHNGSIER